MENAEETLVSRDTKDFKVVQKFLWKDLTLNGITVKRFRTVNIKYVKTQYIDPITLDVIQEKYDPYSFMYTFI